MGDVFVVTVKIGIIKRIFFYRNMHCGTLYKWRNMLEYKLWLHVQMSSWDLWKSVSKWQVHIEYRQTQFVKVLEQHMKCINF